MDLMDFILVVSEDTQVLKDVSKDFEKNGIPVLMSSSYRNTIHMLTGTYIDLCACPDGPLKFKATTVSLLEHGCESSHLNNVTCPKCNVEEQMSLGDLKEHQTSIHEIGSLNKNLRTKAKFNFLKKRKMRDINYLVVAQHDTWFSQKLEDNEIENIVLVPAGEENGESSVSAHSMKQELHS